METISGPVAIAEMRKIKNTGFFKMQHLTWNRNKKESDGIRNVEQGYIRKSLPRETFFPDADIYLPYRDASDNHAPKMCFKRLILYVAFPPQYKWKKVKWF